MMSVRYRTGRLLGTAREPLLVRMPMRSADVETWFTDWPIPRRIR